MKLWDYECDTCGRRAIAAHQRRLHLGVPRRYPMPVEVEERSNG